MEACPRVTPLAPKPNSSIAACLTLEVLKSKDLPLTLCPGPAKPWTPDELLTDRGVS